MPLSSTDLLISDAELANMKAALANLGIADPIGQAANEAEQIFNAYTAKYSLADDLSESLQRALILHQLYSLLTAVPSAVQTKYEAAMKLLTEIRDGKFPDLAMANTDQPYNRSAGGSGTVVLPRL